MKEALERALRVSDGLASLTRKKVISLVRQLQDERVLTAKEGRQVIKGLSRVKKTIYDTVTGELKKALKKHWKAPKRQARRKRNKRRSRR